MNIYFIFFALRISVPNAFWPIKPITYYRIDFLLDHSFTWINFIFLSARVCGNMSFSHVQLLIFYRSSNDDENDFRSWHEKKTGRSHLEIEIYNFKTIYYFVSYHKLIFIYSIITRKQCIHLIIIWYFLWCHVLYKVESNFIYFRDFD